MRWDSHHENLRRANEWLEQLPKQTHPKTGGLFTFYSHHFFTVIPLHNTQQTQPTN